MQEQNLSSNTAKTGGLKHDEKKPRWELLPYDAIKGVVEVLTDGAKKYDARNWELGIAYGRVFGATQRHLSAWWQGENVDPESGRSHLDHALCELIFLSTYEKRGMTKLDDRPLSGIREVVVPKGTTIDLQKLADTPGKLVYDPGYTK